MKGILRGSRRRVLGWAVLCALLFTASAAQAKQPRCPLPLDQCLARFDAMATRPWFGIYSDRDSASGRLTVATVAPGGPAERAGIRVGDVLRTIEGKPADAWFAGRAGWKSAREIPVAVERENQTVRVRLPVERIPDDVLARAVGEHMLEAHLAYLTGDGHTHEEEHRH